MNSIEPRPNSAQHAGQRDQLVVVGVVGRDPSTVVRDVQLQL